MLALWLSKVSKAIKASNPHEWLKSIAIIAAGAWTAYTFTPQVPSQPEVSLALSEKPEARITVSERPGDSFPEYSKLELVLKFTNPASRALWLTSPLIVASGITIGQGHGRASTNLKSYRFIRGNEEKLMDSINRFAITYEPFMLRNVPIESSLPPGSSRTSRS